MKQVGLWNLAHVFLFIMSWNVFLLLRAAKVEKGQVKNPELTQGSNIDQIEKREKIWRVDVDGDADSLSVMLMLLVLLSI